LVVEPVLKSTTYLGRTATKTSVQQENLAAYKRIHFATHAFIDETRPERSGIALSPAGQEDGVLRIKDILAPASGTSMTPLQRNS
jgi:CHAT domain-containing protein